MKQCFVSVTYWLSLKDLFAVHDRGRYATGVARVFRPWVIRKVMNTLSMGCPYVIQYSDELK